MHKYPIYLNFTTLVQWQVCFGTDIDALFEIIVFEPVVVKWEPLVVYSQTTYSALCFFSDYCKLTAVAEQMAYLISKTNQGINALSHDMISRMPDASSC